MFIMDIWSPEFAMKFTLCILRWNILHKFVFKITVNDVYLS